MNKEDKIEISRTNALKAYNSAKGEVKQALKDLIGSEILENPMGTIKTFNDVLEFNGLDQYLWKKKCEFLDENEIALLKFRLVLKAINRDWIPDFNNTNEYKYFLRFTKRGLVWSVDGCNGWDTDSSLPGCFYFKSKELAYYVWEQFNQEFIDYLNAQ